MRNANGWKATTDPRNGWTSYGRGNCRITLPPGGPTAQVPVMLFAPYCTTEHASVEAAKRAAATRDGRGW